MLTADYLIVKMCVKRTGKPDPEYIDFTPEEYFDIDEDEPLDVDSVPRFMEFLDYIEDYEDVYYISVVIENQNNKRKKHFEGNYYDHQNSMLFVVTEYLNQEVRDRELITSMRIPSSEENAVYANDISRFHQKKGEGEFICTLHSLVTTYRDNTQSDLVLPYQSLH